MKPALDPVRKATQDEAHRLLELAYIPVPAIASKKCPAMPWKRLQTNPPTHGELDKLFDQYPLADALGLLTTDFVVVDRDPLGDGSANPFPEEPDLAAAMSRAPTVDTPRNGSHSYFGRPAGQRIRNSTSVLAPNVDIRGQGGFVIVPPSIRDGKPYIWRGDRRLDVPPNRLPELPASIVERLLRKKPPAPSTLSDPTLDAIYEGSRNDTLFRLACRWRRDGHIEREILALLQLHNDLRCTPTIRANELAAIARSVSRYATNAQELAALGQVDEAGKPVGLTVLNSTEFKQIPPPQFVIDRMIPAGVTVAFAEPGLGKSFFALAVGSAVARGLPLLGNPNFKINRSGLVLFALPEGAASWAGRLRSFDSHNFYDDSPEMHFICDGVNLFDAKGWQRLDDTYQRLVRDCGDPPVLIVVDTLAAASPGANENAFEDMGLVMSRLQSLVTRGSNVLLVHHAGKGGNYRGHSSIAASCDAMLHLVKDETTGAVEIFSRKLRDAESIGPCAFEIKQTGDGPVPVASTTRGPWARFNAACDQNEGLAAAIEAHGFRLPGDTAEPDPEAGFRKGVTLRSIQSTWNDLVAPTDRAQRAARTRALIRIIQDLAKARVVAVISGTLKGRQADSLDSVVCQKDPP